MAKASAKKTERATKPRAAGPAQDRREVLTRLRTGMRVRVHQKIREGEKERIQIFEGLVIARHRKNEPGGTFTVRKISEGVGVERIFPVWSPVIERIDLVSQANVRRAKLYYLRGGERKLKETPVEKHLTPNA